MTDGYYSCPNGTLVTNFHKPAGEKKRMSGLDTDHKHF